MDNSAAAPLFDMSKAQPIQTSGAPMFDMSKAQPIGDNTPPPSDNGFNFPQNQGAAQGLKEGASDVWDQVKGVASHPLNAAGGLVGSVAGAYDSIKEMVPVLHAYEQARAGGKGVIDSLSAANDQAKQQNQALQTVKDRADEFKKAPTAAGVRALVDAGATALAMWGGEKIAGSIGGAPEEAAGEVKPTATAEKPGIVQQVLKGKDVAQPQAQAALRATGTGAAPASLRDVIESRISDTFKTAKQSYSAVDEAAGTDLKGLNDKLNKAVRQARMAPTPEAADAWEVKINDLAATIDESEQKAIKAGVDPTTLKQADISFKQGKALEEVNQRVFKNVKVVQGNTTSGTPETVNVDTAVGELQKLQNKDKYGAPRLEEAFGKDGAKELLDNFYEAQRNGVHALKVQQVAKTIGKILGVGAAGGEIIRHL